MVWGFNPLRFQNQTTQTQLPQMPMGPQLPQQDYMQGLAADATARFNPLDALQNAQAATPPPAQMPGVATQLLQLVGDAMGIASGISLMSGYQHPRDKARNQALGLAQIGLSAQNAINTQVTQRAEVKKSQADYASKIMEAALQGETEFKQRQEKARQQVVALAQSFPDAPGMAGLLNNVMDTPVFEDLDPEVRSAREKLDGLSKNSVLMKEFLDDPSGNGRAMLNDLMTKAGYGEVQVPLGPNQYKMLHEVIASAVIFRNQPEAAPLVKAMLSRGLSTFMTEEEIDQATKILTGYTPEFKNKQKDSSTAADSFKLDNKWYEGVQAIAEEMKRLDFAQKLPPGTTTYEQGKASFIKKPEGQIWAQLDEKYMPKDKLTNPFDPLTIANGMAENYATAMSDRLANPIAQKMEPITVDAAVDSVLNFNDFVMERAKRRMGQPPMMMGR